MEETKQDKLLRTTSKDGLINLYKSTKMKNADLLAKVSEQEKEIEDLKKYPGPEWISFDDHRDKIHEQSEELASLRSENEKLKAFKDYVHKRLDDAGIPIDPESPHKAAGCRIGGRLDVVLGELSKLKAERQEWIETLKKAWDGKKYDTSPKTLQAIKSLLDKLNPQK